MSARSTALPPSSFTDYPVTAEVDDDGLYRPTDVEVAVGHLHDGGAGGRPRGEGGAIDDVRSVLAAGRAPSPPRGTARAALERVVAEHLARGPCFVAFSGGRDSSAVLAVAADVAAREGLPAPVALTHGFPAPDGPPAIDDDDGISSDLDERAWQALVLDHLAARGTPVEQVVVPSKDAFDYLGPVARAGLERHGLLWTATLHASTPLWDVARGTTLLTGQGGDEVLGSQRSGGLAMLRRRRGPLRPALVLSGLALTPSRIRTPVAKRLNNQRERPRPWLRPEALAHVRALARTTAAASPLAYPAALAARRRERGFALGLAASGVLAAQQGTVLAHPLFDARFVGALAAEGGALGFGHRTAVLARLVGDLLPREVVHRTSKGRFDAVVIGPRVREFARTWSGGGLDERLLDVEALRANWLSEHPVGGSGMALHAAWLHDGGLPRRPAGVAAGGAKGSAPGRSPVVVDVRDPLVRSRGGRA